MAYTETPLGNALLTMPEGSACSVTTVLVCQKCGTAYADDVPGEDPGFCGPCDHTARYMFTGRVRLHRRERRASDVLALSFRY